MKSDYSFANPRWHAALMAVLMLAGCRTLHVDDARTARGTMVDVGGYALYFNCTLPAPTTVILESGGGGRVADVETRARQASGCTWRSGVRLR